MDLTKLIAACAQQGVELAVNDGNLDVSFDTMPTAELIEQLKSQKQALIEFIGQINNETATPTTAQALCPINRAQALALSPAQARLWLIDQIEGGSAQYNMPSALKIDGPFARDILAQAFNQIIQRHESLRTVFTQTSVANDKSSAAQTDLTQVRQRVLNDAEFNLEFEDLSKLDSTQQQQAIDGAIAIEGSHIFNLAEDLMLRAKVLKLAPQQHILLINMHHIASDGWSVGVLTAELNHFYRQLSGETLEPLPPLNIQYADFADWQLKQLQSFEAQQSFDYWQQQLAGLPQTHNLPLDYPRAAQQTFNGARITQSITASETCQLNQLAHNQGVTLFMLLQTAFAVLLNRYSGEQDIVMGTPVAGRNQPELETLIGFFVNTLVLRSDMNAEQSFVEQLARNKQMLSQAFDHQSVQFEQLVEKLNPQRSMAHNPLFQVMFVLQNATEGELQLADATLTDLAPPKPTIRFDLELKIYPIDGQLQLQWLYNRDLFKPASIERMANNFAVLLQSIVTAPEQSIQALPLLHHQEQQLLLDWNQTEVDFNHDVTMHQLFIEQVSKTPDAIAVIDEQGQISYQQLFEQALAICQQLQQANIAAEELVGVRMAKGRAQVAATLGIMMAGAAYLPMEHFWPDERCAGVVEAANCRWILIDDNSHIVTGCHAEHLYPAEPVQTTSQSTTPQQWLAQAGNQIATDRLAYVIFTSGSTGKPKGVAIEHRSAVNTLLDINQQYKVTQADSVLAVSALSFDLSVYDIFGLLAVGGQVIFPDDELATDPSHWLNMVEKHNISLWDTTPASAVLLAEQLEQLNRVSSATVRHFILSGDWIPPNLPSRLWQVFPQCKVHSQGGATEGSIWSIHYPIEQDTSHLKSIPYGRPLSNQRFFILNDDDQLCPIGVVGQLHIGGIGVAREYYNDSVKTAASYIYHQGLKQKLYRTGDLGRLQVDAQGKPDTIEFIGRVDNQVKVRGYRIEPGEIEATINQHQDVTTSLVLPVGDSSEQRQLAAYICPDGDYLDQQAKALAKAQVKQWTDIFDDAYSESTSDNLETNLSGWNSSYTGTAIPQQQMLEWIEGTVERILACKTPDKANRILEIGCGTGLLLYRYAEHFAAVDAIDISQTALNTIKHNCDNKNWSHVQLHQGDALTLEKLDLDQFDVIVINSVVQYFPNRRYLQQVITTASQKLNDQGKLFIGDVRNLDLLDGHNSAVVRDKLEQTESVKTLAAQVQYAVQQEKELLISPSWFAQLPQQLSQIKQYDIMVKRGYHNNEMLRYRYDVVLHRQAAENLAAPNWLMWKEQIQTEAQLTTLLTESSDSTLHISGYPNHRIAKDLWLANGLRSWHSDHQIDPAQVNDEGIDQAGVPLEQLLQTAEQLGWHGVATWSQIDNQTDLASLDLIFCKTSENLTNIRISAKAPYRQKVQTNYPQLGRLAASLTEGLKQHLSQTLPNYMLPSYYVYLERLPLSANGKIDRKALPVPASEQLERGEYIAPTNAIEHTLCQLCQDILGLERVGIEDNFFAIGGHSLLATRLLAAAKDKLSVALPLRQIFATPTITELAEKIATSLSDNQAALVKITKATPIKQIGDDSYYPLSFAQQRLWFIDQMEGASARYNIAGAFELEGELNQAAFTQAIDAIIQRHDVLRASYQQHNGEPQQLIRASVDTPVSYRTLGATTASEADIANAIQAVTRKPFDLSTDLPIRFEVLELTANKHIVAYAMHHIASDGWSMSRLVEELCLWYQHFSLEQANQPAIPELAIQYQDYACWQRQFLTGSERDNQLAFWQERLQGLPQLHKLPTDKPRPTVQSFAGNKHQITLSTELSAHLQQLAKSQNATLFMLLHSAFSVLLSRYSGESDIVIGTAIAGRSQAELEPLIGFFVNNLVLRSQCDSTLRFNQFLAHNRQFILDAYQHQHLPFEVLVEQLQPTRNLSYSPLFQVMLILQNIDETEFDMPGLTMTPRSNPDTIAKFDLELNVIEYADKLVMQFSYNSDLFFAQTIERMAENFHVLLKGIVDNPQASIAQLPVISAIERQAQLFNAHADTSSSFNPDATIHQLFEQAAQQFADHTALVHGNQHISYQTLNQRANQLAHLLLTQHKKDSNSTPFIGLCLERGPDIIVAILAIVKIGAAYVPIDPKAPLERINHMLDDAQVSLLLSQTQVSEALTLAHTQVINLDTVDFAAHKTCNPQVAVKGNDLAYLIYTSGSTGLPKGVMIEHAALVNSIQSDIDGFKVKDSSRFLHMVSFNFDAATSHLFLTLCAGASLYIYDHQLDKLDLMHYAKAHSISHTALPVSVLAAQEKMPLPSLTTLIVGAEHCPDSLADYWSQGRQFFNVYGPTETTITATYADYNDINQRNTIGKAIRNFSTYVLDSQQRLLPTGAVGELYIGGVGVARGYLNRPELSEKVFLPDPFAANSSQARMYKTGDLVRYTPQGYLEFIGRVDHQVKVRGFRIELGEIEARLDALAEVATNVVIATTIAERGDDKQLIAYVVLAQPNQAGEQNPALHTQAIRRQLASVLPDHMIPSQFVVLDKMPLNINGKIDRKALPAPQIEQDQLNQYLAPRDQLEQTMTQIWQQLLAVEQVGIEDNFFSLGGHSLLATRVLAKIRQELNVELALKRLFEHPTVAALCQVIRSQQECETKLPPIIKTSTKTSTKSNSQEPMPLSFAQQRLWFIDQLEGSSSQYNIPAALRLIGPLDIARLESAFSQIIQRHQVLRTRFIQNPDGSAGQLPQQNWHFNLTVESTSNYQQAMLADANKAFDLSQDLMLRANLLKLAQDDHVLLLNLHHIAADGWSMGLLINELNALYVNNKAQLAPLPVQYSDFANWQRQHLTEQVLQTSLDYWQQQLADLPPVHNLPSDHPRPARQSYRGQMYRQQLDVTLTEQLHNLAQQQDCTLFMLLHGVLSTLLHRYSGDQDIVIGTPVAGRNDTAIEPLIGFFTNTLVLRSRFDHNGQDTSLNHIIQNSRATVLDALNQQILPFEMLVEKLNPERSLSHNPLFQVMLVLQNNQMSDVNLGDVSFSPITPDVSSTQFDLNLNINEIDGKLYINWQYATDLFEQSTISRMASHFAQLLQAFVTSPQQPLSKLALSADSELTQWQQGPELQLQQTDLVSVFEQQVDSNPAAIALMHQHDMSYGELDKRANYQAQQLIAQGVRHGDIVCLYAERSVEMFVAMVAILKAGAAYMPIDPILPDAMITKRLTLAAPKAVLIGPSLTQKAQSLFGGIAQLILTEQSSDTRVKVDVSADTSAYVLFTSGSTGEPKGIDMSHGALVNLIGAIQLDCPSINSSSEQQAKLLQFASIGFDMSFTDAYLSFATGSALQLIDESMKADVAALIEIINQQSLTVLNLPYALLQALCEHCNDHNLTLPSVEVIFSTAEQLKITGQIRQYFNRHIKQHHTRPSLINHYGPTETHVVTSLVLEGEPDDWPALPGIGKPIANCQCVILDQHGNIQPQGVYGELYLGGANVAKGYLNREDLTLERFVTIDGQRFYRSGDWARWHDDGSLEYQGRIDNQVKLRGFRVELGDIEACLLRHQQVEKAVVLVIEQQVCAYVESSSGQSDQLINWCRSHLPDYMVPQHVLVLAQFKLNTNGKIDRRALPQPQLNRTSGELPASDSEIQLAALWQELLKLDGDIYRDDNFFNLGGHSLLITRLSSAVQSRWHINLPVSTVFEQQQLSTLAQWIDEQVLLIQGVSSDSLNDSSLETSDDEWEF